MALRSVFVAADEGLWVAWAIVWIFRCKEVGWLRAVTPRWWDELYWEWKVPAGVGV
eukprot:COSAG02_NODE_64983_length_259_cov_0.643750_1_plen_55_part_01